MINYIYSVLSRRALALGSSHGCVAVCHERLYARIMHRKCNTVIESGFYRRISSRWAPRLRTALAHCACAVWLRTVWTPFIRAFINLLCHSECVTWFETKHSLCQAMPVRCSFFVVCVHRPLCRKDSLSHVHAHTRLEFYSVVYLASSNYCAAACICKYGRQVVHVKWRF